MTLPFLVLLLLLLLLLRLLLPLLLLRLLLLLLSLLLLLLLLLLLPPRWHCGHRGYRCVMAYAENAARMSPTSALISKANRTGTAEATKKSITSMGTSW